MQRVLINYPRFINDNKKMKITKSPLKSYKRVVKPLSRSLVISNSVIKKPDLSDPVLRAKLAKGMGHNYYGEPAWPNDLLYMFPVVILATIALSISLAVMEPTPLGEPADPFATPLEILPCLLYTSPSPRD